MNARAVVIPATLHGPVARPRTGDGVYEVEFAFVWRTLRRLGVQVDQLDDAAHDVFLVVFRRLAEFQGRSSFRTWLFGIAHNVANQYRSKDKKPPRRRGRS